MFREEEIEKIFDKLLQTRRKLIKVLRQPPLKGVERNKVMKKIIDVDSFIDENGNTIMLVSFDGSEYESMTVDEYEKLKVESESN